MLLLIFAYVGASLTMKGTTDMVDYIPGTKIQLSNDIVVGIAGAVNEWDDKESASYEDLALNVLTCLLELGLLRHEREKKR